jgi:hypothetical protein
MSGKTASPADDVRDHWDDASEYDDASDHSDDSSDNDDASDHSDDSSDNDDASDHSDDSSDNDDATDDAVPEKFVAMPSETMWKKGFRPGWILSETRDPPETYSDGQKMYKTYLKMGKIIYPKKSAKGNSAKGTAFSYMNKYSRKKGRGKK